MPVHLSSLFLLLSLPIEGAAFVFDRGRDLLLFDDDLSFCHLMELMFWENHYQTDEAACSVAHLKTMPLETSSRP